jgi:aquaporin Z
MEAALLGAFMVAICIFILTLGSSPCVLATAIGVTAAVLIHSPWGKRTGAHLNPAVSLAFWLLGRVKPWDALFYSLAQIAGATLGVFIVVAFAGKRFTDPPVLYAVTVPGPTGEWIAFLAEAVISALLMTLILAFVGSPRLIRFTGIAVGALIALLILIEAPLSGTSMNPARTLASAIPGRMWEHLWIYLTAPPLGMFAAAYAYRRFVHPRTFACAKLLHPVNLRCIHCGFDPARNAR